MSVCHEVVTLARQGERDLPLLRALRWQVRAQDDCEASLPERFRWVSTVLYIRSNCSIVIKCVSFLRWSMWSPTSLSYMYHNNVISVLLWQRMYLAMRTGSWKV